MQVAKVVDDMLAEQGILFISLDPLHEFQWEFADLNLTCALYALYIYKNKNKNGLVPL